jgi:hypothetical protein
VKPTSSGGLPYVRASSSHLALLTALHARVLPVKMPIHNCNPLITSHTDVLSFAAYLIALGSARPAGKWRHCTTRAAW